MTAKKKTAAPTPAPAAETTPVGREPGVYLGLSMDEYHDDPALGSSGIKTLINDGPLAYWWDSPLNPDREKDETTISKKFGTAYHTLILEPEKFKYEVKPGVKSTKEEGKLGEGEYAEMMMMKGRLLGNEKRRALFQGGVGEVSVFFKDPETGIMCKVRYDYFTPDWIVDLKTCSSVNDRRLRYDIPDFGYDVSGAMYSVAAHALKDMLRNGYELPAGFPEGFKERFLANEKQIFAFAMQGKDAPFIARTKLLTAEVAGVGRDKMRRGLEIYNEHKAIEGAWPSGYDDFEDMLLDDLSPSINYF